MGPITAIIPVPQTVLLAGEPFQVGEARLLDLADLQAWLDSRWNDPLDAIRPQLATAEGEARRLLLVDAYEKAEEGPPCEGTERGDQMFATAEGLAVLFWVALKRYQPHLNVGEVNRIAANVTVDEYVRFRRVFYGGNTLKEIESLLMPPLPRRKGNPVTWGQAVDEVAQLHGWPYPVIYQLTVTEFVNARTGGKREEGRSLGGLTDEQIAREVREQYKRYHGHYPDESPAAPKATVLDPSQDGWVFPAGHGYPGAAVHATDHPDHVPFLTEPDLVIPGQGGEPLDPGL